MTTPETLSTCSKVLPLLYSLTPIVPDAGLPVSFMSVGPLAPSKSMSSPSSSSAAHSSNVLHWVPSFVTLMIVRPDASPESSPAAIAASAMIIVAS